MVAGPCVRPGCLGACPQPQPKLRRWRRRSSLRPCAALLDGACKAGRIILGRGYWCKAPPPSPVRGVAARFTLSSPKARALPAVAPADLRPWTQQRPASTRTWCSFARLAAASTACCRPCNPRLPLQQRQRWTQQQASPFGWRPQGRPNSNSKEHPLHTAPTQVISSLQRCCSR